MSLDSFWAIVVLLVFFIPGLIILAIIERYLPTVLLSDRNRLLTAGIYSSVNYGILLLLWPLWSDRLRLIINDWPSVPLSFWWDGAFVVLALFLLPIIIGAAFVILSGRTWTDTFAKKVLGSTKSKIPTAWETFFFRGVPCWVILHLKDGETAGGVYSENSCVAHDVDRLDIYLEELWELDESGHGFAGKRPNSMGGYFKYEDIKNIEFLSSEGQISAEIMGGEEKNVAEKKSAPTPNPKKGQAPQTEKKGFSPNKPLDTSKPPKGGNGNK